MTTLTLLWLQVTSAAEVQDIKRARTLMKSMCTSNPGNARGWIAYARLEEVTGNLKTARTLISQVPKTPQCLLVCTLESIDPSYIHVLSSACHRRRIAMFCHCPLRCVNLQHARPECEAGGCGAGH